MASGDMWACHACGKSRTDVSLEKVLVDLVYQGKVIGKIPIRYCNDNDECKRKVIRSE